MGLHRCLLAAVLALSSRISSVDAFTNGTLLPAYICGPTNAAGATDGYPKSLGGVLPFFVEATNPQFVTVNGVAPNGNLDADMGGSVLHTRLLLANFHNKNSTTPYEHVIETNLTASNAAAYGTPKFVPTPNVIIPGRNHTVTITVTPFDLGQPSNLFCLDGALVYAYSNSLNQRVGSFVATGPVMQSFGACGPFNVGVVHNQLISNFNGCNVGFYDQLVWYAPPFLVPGSTVTFKGAAVSDNGYGAHSTTQVVGTPPVAIPAAPQISQVLVLGTTDFTIFFVDPVKNAHTNIAATSFTVTASVSAGGATTATLGSANIVKAAFTSISQAPAVFTVTTKQSPATFNLKNILNVTKMAGAIISVEVTANNAAGTSSTSNYVSFAVGNYQTVPAALSLFIATNWAAANWPTQNVDSTQTFDAAVLCNQQQATTVAQFSMSASDDVDGACAYQTTLTDSLAAQATGVVTAADVTGTTTSTSSMDETGTIIAAAVAGVLLLVVVVLGITVYKLKNQLKHSQSTTQMKQATSV